MSILDINFDITYSALPNTYPTRKNWLTVTTEQGQHYIDLDVLTARDNRYKKLKNQNEIKNILVTMTALVCDDGEAFLLSDILRDART